MLFTKYSLLSNYQHILQMCHNRHTNRRIFSFSLHIGFYCRNAYHCVLAASENNWYFLHTRSDTREVGIPSIREI